MPVDKMRCQRYEGVLASGGPDVRRGRHSDVAEVGQDLEDITK